MKRPSLPSAIEVEVLVKSARRCALCYGLDDDYSEKQGQIAHLDKNSSNHNLSNLIFLCLNHHDRFDGKTSQSKGYRKSELIHYRESLHEKVKEGTVREDVMADVVENIEKDYDLVHNIPFKYHSLSSSPDVLLQNILTRCRAVHEFIRLDNQWYEQNSENDNLDENAFYRSREANAFRLMKVLDIPEGVYGIYNTFSALPESWLEESAGLVKAWVKGECSYDECTDILCILDERFDLDLHWILYGIPNKRLPRLAYQFLHEFVYTYGMRGQSQYIQKDLTIEH